MVLMQTSSEWYSMTGLILHSKYSTGRIYFQQKPISLRLEWQTFSDLVLQLLVKTRRRRRTWRRSAVSPSQLSSDQLCGTKPSPMMETSSSWSTWIWKSFCQRTASRPVPLTISGSSTRPTTSHRASRPSWPRCRPLRRTWWWTSAATPPPLSSPLTACTATRQDQVSHSGFWSCMCGNFKYLQQFC